MKGQILKCVILAFLLFELIDLQVLCSFSTVSFSVAYVSLMHHTLIVESF